MAKPTTKSITLETGMQWLDKDGILWVKFNEHDPDKELTMVEMEAHIKAFQQLSDGKKVPFLVDLRDIKKGKVSIEARELIANSPKLKTIQQAEAIVVDSLAMKLTVNNYIRLSRPNCPSMVFVKIEKAVNWLNMVRKTNEKAQSPIGNDEQGTEAHTAKRLMIVDDNKMLRSGLKALLCNKPDVKVIQECEDGSEVMDALKKNNIDLILMDISMKVMNGIDATRIVKQKFPDVKVIALSMHQEEAYIQEMYAAGTDGFILKSTQPPELFLAIDEVLDGRGYMCKELSVQFNKYARDKNLEKLAGGRLK